MEWGGYQASESVDYFSLDKRSARTAFNELLEVKADRIAQLRRLVALNGFELGDDVAAVDVLESWLWGNAELERGKFELTNRWRSVCHDVGLFLGDVLILRHPTLAWSFLDLSEKFEDRFAPAVVGFGVKNKWYGPAFPLDVQRMVLSHLLGGVLPAGSLSHRLRFYENVAEGRSNLPGGGF
jgi:hypothetical protein